MPPLPLVIPSRLINFAVPNDDPAIYRYRRLAFGGITLTRQILLPNSGVYIGSKQVIVSRHCGLPLRLEWRSPENSTLMSKVLIPGTVNIKPAQEKFWQRWMLPATVLIIAFEKEFFEKLSIQANGTTGDLVGELGVNDPALSELTRLLDRELINGGLNGRLYIENLGAALATYLLQRRTGRQVSTSLRNLRLAPVRLRRVLEYIDANLGHDLSLDQISAVVGLNTHHFAHAFKATTGIPPHRFITDRRIRMARSYLESTQDPIASIALSCGFASQSHFTQVFRRVIGVTPAQYRIRL